MSVKVYTVLIMFAPKHLTKQLQHLTNPGGRGEKVWGGGRGEGTWGEARQRLQHLMANDINSRLSVTADSAPRPLKSLLTNHRRQK